MARDGAGNMTIPTPDFVAGTTISSSEVDANNADIVAELTNSIACDGQSVITANIPVAGFKLTGLGVGSAATDSANLGQAQAQAYIWCGTAGGTADAITLSPSPAITAYAAGQTFRWKASANANTGAMTVAISGLTTIAAQSDLSALSAGDHEANAIYEGTLDTTSTIQIKKIALGFSDPLTTRGDLIYRDASATTRLAIGTANTVLRSDGTDAAWGDVAVADLADGTDGELITWDASGNPATVAVGTSGHVLTSNGAGAAPTFQASTGGLVPLATATASTSASIDFATGIDGTYDEYVVKYFDVRPATDSVAFYIRVSTDGGSSWVSGAGTYQYANQGNYAGGANTTDSSTSATQIQISQRSFGNATSEIATGEIHLMSPSTSEQTIIHGLESHKDQTGAITTSNFAGIHLSTTAVNGIQVLFSSGDITSGVFHLYGVVKPT